jgi:hypothetical protein
MHLHCLVLYGLEWLSLLFGMACRIPERLSIGRSACPCRVRAMAYVQHAGGPRQHSVGRDRNPEPHVVLGA